VFDIVHDIFLVSDLQQNAVISSDKPHMKLQAFTVPELRNDCATQMA